MTLNGKAYKTVSTVFIYAKIFTEYYYILVPRYRR